MVALYEAADTHISRVLDVCTELNALRAVLDSTPVGFAIELVALAAQRDLVNLDQWLQDRVAFHRQPFLQARSHWPETCNNRLCLREHR